MTSVLKESSILSEAPSVSTPPIKAMGPRGRRGKESLRKHNEAFRTKAGDRTKDDYKSQIFKDTFGELDTTIKQLSDLCISNSPITVQLPVTTRGIGLLVNAAYSTAQLYSKQTLPMSKNQLYRATLAQLELQLIRAEMVKTGVKSVEQLSYQYPDSDFVNFEQTTVSHTTTLKPLALAVNSVGTFTLESTNYAPLVPNSCVRAGIRNDASSSGIKRPKKDDPTLWQPDPYIVTFKNLRKTVMALNRAETPPSVRRFFREHNPFPGALWTDDDRLQNPDEIMPNNYTVHTLRNELRLLDSLVSRLQGKFSHFLGELTFSGKGSASQLCSAYTDCYLNCYPSDTVHQCDYQVSTEDFYGVRPIPTQLMAIGAMSLVGEYPEYPSFEFGIDDQLVDHRSPALGAKTYSIRSQPLQVQRYPVEWDALEAAISVRH